MPLPAAKTTAADSRSKWSVEWDVALGNCIQKMTKTRNSDFRQLARQDSNLDKQYQKLLCYRYTTGQLPEAGTSIPPRRAKIMAGSFVRPRMIRWEPGQVRSGPTGQDRMRTAAK